MGDDVDFRRPPLAEQGDKESSTIYSAVGLALSTWEHTEQRFAAVFSKLVSPPASGYAAQRAYGTVVPANVRRQMIESASEVFFRNFPSDKAEAELKNLMKLHEAASARRNDFAHGIIGGDDVNGKFWHFLVPNTWGSKSRDLHLQIDYRYSSAQILDFERRFGLLSGRATTLRELLDKTYHAAPERARQPY
jgi:hypothetical protein